MHNTGFIYIVQYVSSQDRQVGKRFLFSSGLPMLDGKGVGGAFSCFLTGGGDGRKVGMGTVRSFPRQNLGQQGAACNLKLCLYG